MVSGAQVHWAPPSPLIRKYADLIRIKRKRAKPVGCISLRWRCPDWGWQEKVRDQAQLVIAVKKAVPTAPLARFIRSSEVPPSGRHLGPEESTHLLKGFRMSGPPIFIVF